jgi:predicted ATPase
MTDRSKNKLKEKAPTIQSISVCGFKSIAEKQKIEIKPLTVLAGANSSGKSSMIQPLLLMKQTLEATYDPGVFLLDGPNIKFSKIDQMFSRLGGKQCKNRMIIQLEIQKDRPIEIVYKKEKTGLSIEQMTYRDEKDNEEIIISENLTHEEIENRLGKIKFNMFNYFQKKVEKNNFRFSVIPERCFLGIYLSDEKKNDSLMFRMSPAGITEQILRRFIHLPGLRGNPERNYVLAAIEEEKGYFGVFQNYVASLLHNWQINNDERLDKVNSDLKKLHLVYGVRSERVDDTKIEVKVGRMVKCGNKKNDDMVSIADVGIGVSQVLPVVVALQAAEPGQLVFIEQPEIHLHPKAQVEMAEILVNAAKRGVRTIIETHSPTILLGIQILVAEGKCDPDLIKLHWFTRNENGITTIDSRDLDNKGRYGDWPEDFGETELKLQDRYLTAVEEWE